MVKAREVFADSFKMMKKDIGPIEAQRKLERLSEDKITVKKLFLSSPIYNMLS